MVMCVFHKRPSPARLFVAAYFFVTMYFSSKMVRLVLLLDPRAPPPLPLPSRRSTSG